jgi:hypothetical protein
VVSMRDGLVVDETRLEEGRPIRISELLELEA